MESESSEGASGKVKNMVNKVTLQDYTKRSLQYEPALNRTVKNPSSYCETFMNMVKASIGTGILAMPHAFSKAGYMIGIIFTILIGLLCMYCQRTIVAVQYELCKRHSKPTLSYMNTARFSLLEGPECSRNFKAITVIANICLFLFQLGCSCIYMIFVATNVKNVVENHSHFTGHLILYMLITTGLLFFTATISSLKFMAILNFLANAATLTSFALLARYIFIGDASIADKKMVGDAKNIPLFIGTVLFSMEAIGTMIPLENEMKNPLLFTSTFGVVNISMIPITLLYVLVGFFGYINYGDNVNGTITLNLPQGEWLADICKLLMVFGIYATNVLVLYVTCEIIWTSYVVKDESTEVSYGASTIWLFQYMIKVGLIILTFLVAVLIPNLELLISLTGALCLATAGVAFPALFNLFTYWEDYKGSSFCLFMLFCSFIIVCGVMSCLIGVYTSVESIWTEVWSKKF